jgi:hypothetical protein
MTIIRTPNDYMFQRIPFIPTIYDGVHHILPSDHKLGVVLIQSQSESQAKNLQNYHKAILIEMDQGFPQCLKCLDLGIVVGFHTTFPNATGSPTTAAARL